MNDIIFSKSFFFCRYAFTRAHYTDNRAGITHHFFAYMQKGRGRLVGEGETVEIAPGDIFYIPYGCRYESFWQGEPEIAFISLRFPSMPCFKGERYPMQAFPAQGDEVARMERLLGPMTDAHVGMLYTLIGTLTPRMKQIPISRGEALVLRAREMIAREPHADTEAIARGCGVSASALYAAFARHGGMTPNAWRTRVLCEQARDLLITTDTPIEEVARRLGFSSPAYFRRVMQRELGMAPREVRRARQV